MNDSELTAKNAKTAKMAGGEQTLVFTDYQINTELFPKSGLIRTIRGKNLLSPLAFLAFLAVNPGSFRS